MHRIALFGGCGGVASWRTVQPLQSRKEGRKSEDDDDDDDSMKAELDRQKLSKKVINPIQSISYSDPTPHHLDVFRYYCYY
jgi:hypothetical protein